VKNQGAVPVYPKYGKYLKRRSYGLQDFEYLVLKILNIYGKPSSKKRRRAKDNKE
jgi:hypothetical protein